MYIIYCAKYVFVGYILCMYVVYMMHTYDLFCVCRMYIYIYNIYMYIYVYRVQSTGMSICVMCTYDMLYVDETRTFRCNVYM